MRYDWRFLKRKSIFQRCFLEIFQDSYNNGADGHEASFYIIDLPDWINIVATTADNKLLLIRQYRFGSRAFHLEIPGGAIDHQDRDALSSARRELLEETGYCGGEWLHIGTVDPNPAIQSNRCSTFLARGVRYEREPEFDENEDIETILVDADKAYEMIENGEINHSLVICALMFAKKYLI